MLNCPTEQETNEHVTSARQNMIGAVAWQLLERAEPTRAKPWAFILTLNWGDLPLAQMFCM